MASVKIKNDPVYVLTLSQAEAAILGTMLRKIHPNSTQMAKDLKSLGDNSLPRLIDTNISLYILDGLSHFCRT